MANLEHLFSPIQIGTMRVKNRIKMSAMGIHYPELINPDGSYTQRGIEYFIERAKGGVGLITTGACKCRIILSLMNQRQRFPVRGRDILTV
ncbi:MAG: hypothetical protein Q4D45_10675 [Lachnospiraceae bacterium]|nr:hypothetical protein [Lachnospiraceae bacterium]